jgi:hypothetical protein
MSPRSCCSEQNSASPKHEKNQTDNNQHYPVNNLLINDLALAAERDLSATAANCTNLRLRIPYDSNEFLNFLRMAAAFRRDLDGTAQSGRSASSVGKGSLRRGGVSPPSLASRALRVRPSKYS